MVQCLCVGDPIESDPRFHLQARQWETSMMDACCNNPKGCCLGCFCPPCFSYHLRSRALQHDLTKYRCCQGYICGKCTEACVPGQESCPAFCLFLEVWCCHSCAISATRIFVQDERQIITDPCDNRLIRFNNCMQMAACICWILAIFFREARLLARLLDLASDLVYCATQACMQSQVHLELKLHPTVAHYGPPGATESTPIIDKPPAYQQF